MDFKRFLQIDLSFGEHFFFDHRIFFIFSPGHQVTTHRIEEFCTSL